MQRWLAVVVMCIAMSGRASAQEPASAAGEVASFQLTLSDAWLRVIARKERRQHKVNRILAPVALGAAATVVGGLLLSDEGTRRERLFMAGTVAATTALVLPTALVRDGRRMNWLAAGVGTMITGGGAALLDRSYQKRDCFDCSSSHDLRYTGGTLLAMGAMYLVLSLAVPARPEIEELEAISQLASDERKQATERMLARLDRNDRHLRGWTLGAAWAGAVVSGVGLATSETPEDRRGLVFLATYSMATAVLSTIMALASPTRLGRYQQGHPPRTSGWVRF